jgi:hypothetical protein
MAAITTEQDESLSAIHAAFMSKALTDGQKDQMKDIKKNISRPDLQRELGLERQNVQRTRRMQAMTDPAVFNTKHTEALTAMGVEIERVYDLNFDQLITAGLTENDAKASAMSVAKATMAAQQKAIETEYGSDARTILAAKKITESAAATTGIKF